MTHRRLSIALLIVALIAAAVNMRSPIVMIGSVTDVLSTSLGLSTAQIGYLGALPMPLFALGALFAPQVAARFGLERVILVMTLLLTAAVATRVWLGVTWLFIGTLLLSFAIGFLNALTAPFIKKYAPNHIAIATGTFSLSMSVMAGVSAWLVVPMTETLSWQIALSVWAIFGVLSFLLYALVSGHHLMNTPQQQTDKYIASPQPTNKRIMSASTN